MKTLTALTITLATTTIGLVAEPAPAANATLSAKSAVTPLTVANKEMTYSERFDLEERFVDTVVYTMMDLDHSLIEGLFDINAVKVSSNGQFATVAWRYDRTISGITLLEQHSDTHYISILAERSEALPQYSLEVMGIPSSSAAEIAIH